MRYFLSKTNRVYSFLIHQNIWHLYLGTLCFFLLCSITWFFAWHQTIQKKINNLRNQHAHHYDINDYKNHKNHHRNCINDIQKLKVTLLQKKSLCKNYTVATITDAFKHLGIKPQELTIEKHKKGHLIVQTKYTATIDQLISLFDWFDQKKITIKTTQLSLQHIEHNNLFSVQCDFKLHQLTRKEHA